MSDTLTAPNGVPLRPHTRALPLLLLLALALWIAAPTLAAAGTSARPHTRAHGAACTAHAKHTQRHRRSCPSQAHEPRTHSPRHAAGKGVHRTSAPARHPARASAPPAACEDGSAPSPPADGSLACDDGSEPAEAECGDECSSAPDCQASAGSSACEASTDSEPED